MKKNFIIAIMVAFGISFQSCKKDEKEVTSITEKVSSSNTKSIIYGDIVYEQTIYSLGNITDAHFENQSPTVGEWVSYFYENYTTNITIPTSTVNEVEFNSLVNDYLDDLFSPNFTPGNNDFRNNWLNSIASNEILSTDEKELISNVVYVSNSFAQIVSNNGNPKDAHPWEGRFNACMGDAVPRGPFAGFAWVMSGTMFLDVGDCIGVASGWW